MEFVLTAASGGVTLSDPMTHAVTIIDNEQPRVPAAADLTATLSVDSITLPEGATRQIEIRLSGKAPSDLTFTLVQISGSATADVDYTLSPMEIVIAADEREVTVEIEANDDNATEGDESFTLQLGSVLSRVAIGTTGTITVTIPANDQRMDPVTATLSLDNITVSEGMARTFEIELSGNAPEDLVFTLVGDSAYTGDYTLSPAPIMISRDGNRVTVTIMAVDDVAAESDEVFVLNLMSSSSLVNIGDPGSITVTIPANDQRMDPVTATLSLDNITVSEGMARTFEIELSGNAPEDLVFTLVGDSAYTGDYTLSPAPIMISRDGNRVTVTIMAVDDVAAESDEVFVLNLMSSSSLVNIGDPGSITVTIPANDQRMDPVTATLSLDNITVSEGMARTFEIELSGNAPEDLVFTLVGDSAYTGDYTLSPAPIMISRDGNRVTVTIMAVDDVAAESDEVFVLNLMSSSSLVNIGDPGSITVTIPANDQRMDPVTATLSLDNITVPEGMAGTFEIELSGNAPEDLVFTLVGDSAYAGDYTLSPAPIVISRDGNRVTVTIMAVDDVAAESDEVFVLNLMSSSSLVNIGDPGSITVTIPANDQSQPPPEATHIEFVVLTASIEEGEEYQIELRLVDSDGISRTHSDNVVVTLEVFDADTDSLAGEYMFSSMVTIPAGQITGVSRFISVEDTDVEPDERVTLQISAVTMVSSSPLPGRDSRDMFTITVREDDAEIGFSGSPYVVSEAAGGVTITIDIAGRLTEDVTLNYEIDPGTASETEDYVAPLTREVPLSAGATRATLFVQIANDGLYENADTFSVRLFETVSGLPVGVELATGMTEAAVTITNDDEIEIGFVEGMYTFLENQGRGTAQVRYSGSEIAPGVTVTVSYATTVEIGDSIDINDVSGTLMLSSGQRVYNINFPITDDNAFNRETERYTVSLETLDMNSGLTFRLDRVSASLNVLTDDVLTFGFSATEYEVNEASGTVKLEVRVLGNTIGAGERVRVRYSTTPGSATSADFEPVMMGEVTLSSTSTVVTFEIPITDDDILENSESFVVTLTKVDGRDTLRLSSNRATVKIIDNDMVEIGFESATYSVDEGAGTVALTVKVLKGSLGRAVTLNYGTVDGTATAGEDYTSKSDTLTLSSSDTEVKIMVDITDDALFENAEMFTVVLSSAPTGVTLTPVTAMVTISDDSVAPPPDDDMVVIGFDPVMYTVDEGAGTVRLTVKVLSGDLGRAVTLDYETRDGTATAGEDYTSKATTLTLSAGATEATIVVDITNDGLLENDEMFTVVLSGAPAGVTLTPDTAEVTITDTNAPDAVEIGFDPVMKTVDEGAGTVRLTVKVLNGSLGRDITLNYRTVDGTATAGEDYTSKDSMLTLSAGATEATIEVDITDDALLENAETFTVVLSGAPSGVTLTPDTAEVTITDTNAPDVVVIGFEPVMYTVDEGAGTIELTVKVLSGELGRAVTLDYTTVDGTATAGEDYTSTMDMIVLSDTIRSATFTVQIIDDALLENAEMFTVVLSGEPAGVTLNPASAEVTINDDRVAPPTDDDMVVIGFDPDTYTVDEGAGTVRLTVKVLSGSLGRDITLNYRTVDGTATAGEDYTSKDSMLTLSAGATEATIEVDITDDALLENAEMFTVVLSGAPAGVTLTPDTAEVTITDTNAPDVVVIGFEPVMNTVDESAGTVRLTVKVLNGSLGRDITLNYRTVDGTAIAGEDYTSKDSMLTLSAGAIEATIEVDITDETLFEDDEMFTVVLSAAPSGVTLNPDTAEVTISNDESPPTLVIEGVKRLEEGNSAIITVRLDGATLAKKITVSLTRVGDSSTVDANDYELVALDDVILAGETTATFRLTTKLTLTADMQDRTEIDEMLALIARVPEFKDSAQHVVTIPGIAAEIVRPDPDPDSDPDPFDACKLAPSGVEACVDGNNRIFNESLLVVIEKAAPGFLPVELPPDTTYLKTDLLWNIYFVKEAGLQDEVPRLDRRVRVEFTAPRDVVDANGGPDAIAIAVLHGGEQEWEVLRTFESSSGSPGKYRFYAYTTRFSHFTLIVQPEDDDYFVLPPTGGLALPLWLVAVLLLTGLTLVVGTVYVVRRRPTAPRI